MSKKLTLEDFIGRANEKHGYKYDYSKSIYVNFATKLTIVCKEHGEFFQKPNDHLSGYGCKKCGSKSASNKRKKSNESFIQEAIFIHGDKYDYSLVKYKNKNTKVKIVCPIHGEFLQTPTAHIIQKSGCNICGIERTKYSLSFTKDDFVNKAIDVHSNKYNYSLVEYINNRTKVIIICSIHGEFLQSPDTHLMGRGCKECAIDKKRIRFSMGKNEFEKQARQIHGDIYNYDKVDYKTNKEAVIIICPIHGEFSQRPDNHLHNHGCNKCYESKGEKLIRTYLESLNIEFITQKSFIDCTHILSLRFDFYIPELNILIEYQGIQHYESIEIFGGEKTLQLNQKRDQIKRDWCKEKGYKLIEISYKNPFEIYDYDFNLLKLKKTFNLEINNSTLFPLTKDIDINYCNINYPKNNINLLTESDKKLITIYSDQLRDKYNIVISRLNGILGKNNRIYARKCKIKEISNGEMREFLIKNHIQGYVNSKIRLGLFYHNELVALMSFGKFRKNMGRAHKEDCYELLRFCNKLNFTVVGAAGKLLSYFNNNYKPDTIISYADKNWSNGDLYEKLGFNFVKDTQPNYYYVINNKRFNRFKFRKSNLIKQGFDNTKTESEIMKELGYSKLYDCGSKLYIISYVY